MHPQIHSHFRTASLLIVQAPIHRRPVPVVPFALQDAQVRSPEAGVAQGVTHRIYGGVYVAQVVEEIPQLRGDARARRRHRLQQHQDVVRRPRDDEGQQDGGERLGGLLVRLLLLRLLLLLALVLGRVGQQRLARQLFRVERYPDVRHGGWPSDVITLVLAVGVVRLVGVVPGRHLK